MNQPRVSTVGFSSRKCPATHHTLQAAHHRQTSPVARPKAHFLVDRNERIQSASIAVTHSKQTTASFSTRYKVTVVIYRTFPHHNLPATRVTGVISSRSSLATSHCQFHETLNCQPARLGIALTPTKQTAAPHPNRQLSRSSCTTNRTHRVKGCGSPITNRQSPVAPLSSRATCCGPRRPIRKSQVTNHESHS
jgi:hypothetical protein